MEKLYYQRKTTYNEDRRIEKWKKLEKKEKIECMKIYTTNGINYFDSYNTRKK